MSLNWKEINAVLSELNLAGMHIQQVRQPDYTSIILDLYKPGGGFCLLISLASGAARLHSLSRKYSSKKKQPRFSEFLRSRIKGGKILSAEQLGTERIIRLEISRNDLSTILWVRLWSGASNIIAADPDGTILETFYRRPGKNEVSGGMFKGQEILLQTRLESSDIATYSIRNFPGEGTLNDRIESYYYHLEISRKNEQLRKQADSMLTQRENKVRSLIARLHERISSYGRYDVYKETGDLILSNLHRITKGDAWIRVDDYYRIGTEREIELDPDLTPRENAEKYFRKYHKGKSGLATTEDELLNQERMLARILELRNNLDSDEEIQKIIDFLSEESKKTVKSEREDLPGLSFRSGDFSILVGRTAKENDELLRKYVRGNDMWLHVRDYPGSYVFIRHRSGKSVPLDVLLDAGNLALFYSKARTSGHGDLYYTFVKYLRRAKDGKTGLVLPTQEKNLHIKLDERRLEKLQNG